MAVFNRFASTSRKASAAQPADGEDDMQDIARARMQQPAGAQSSGMAGIGTSDAVGMGRGPQGPSANVGAVGRGVGQAPNAPTTPPPGSLPNAPDPKQAALDAAKQKARENTAAWEKAHGGAPYNPAVDDPEMNNIAAQRLQQQQDYSATQQQLEEDKQKSLLDARARAGLGGMGLSGATSAQQGDISRAADRTATQTLADLRTSQNADLRASDDQKFKDEQRQAAIDLLEQEGNFDANGDGMVAGQKVGGKIGDGNPDDYPGNAPTPPPPANGGHHTAAGDIANATNSVGDYFGMDDPHTALRPNGRQPLPKGFDPNDKSIVDGGLTLGGIAGVDTYIGSDSKYDYYRGGDRKIHREPKQ
jgi:hypothetical protein